MGGSNLLCIDSMYIWLSVDMYSHEIGTENASLGSKLQ